MGSSKTSGTVKPGTCSLRGVIKLWTDPNKVNNPDPIFDKWKLVKERGKRNAETSNSVESKRSDKRDTPTRMKQQAGTVRPKATGPSYKTRPAKQVEDAPKPHVIKNIPIFHNPYRNPKKQVDHQAICTNRPLAWQQCLSVPQKKNPTEGAASHNQIDAIVDNFYAGAPSSTTTRNRRKRKNASWQLVE
jgi:hypothetical protein